MKLIYRTLLLNKVGVQGSGAARRCAVSLTKRKVCSDMEFIKVTHYA